METDNKYPLLTDISPAVLKKLDINQLNDLCGEIRSKLIETVSKNGGHLASNLGTVELTVAIHKSFNLPEDTLVWDVGHQAYTHKLITGRYEKFDTLRKENGISGFVRPDESEFDSFYEGHAGTSVSQASGVAAANAIKGNKNYSVAVIGDGSFGNGMVYEALNSAGESGNRLIVILNDNEMSISENVGSMARHLAEIRAKPEYYRFKARTEKALNHIPLIGRHLAKFFFNIKTLIKSIIYKSSFFEDIGFRYIGPIDGHDIDMLCAAFDSAKMVNGPVLVHVNTIKGKGYDFAEKTPELYHGVSEFNVNFGCSGKKGNNFSAQFGEALCDFASKDKRICAVTAAMSLGTGLEDFFDKFKERSFDVGIAEEHAVTFCSGLAASGMIPVFAVYSTFLQRCADQIIHDGALQRRKMIIAVDRAGFVGEDGETHQGIYDVSIMQGIPGITIYSPSNYKELSRSLYNSLYKDENLVVIRYPRGSEKDSHFIGNGEDFEVFGDEEADNIIVTYGRLFAEASDAYDILSKKNIKTKIIKLNKIKPIPEEAVNCVHSEKNVFFFEEGVIGGGVGERFGSSLASKSFGGCYKHIGVNDEFVSHASVSSLMKRYNLDGESMAKIITEEL